MGSDARKLVLWLMPAVPECDALRAVAHELAAQYDASQFEPHLTLCSTGFDDAFDFTPLDRLAMPRAIELEIDSLQHSEKYTKTLFVRFRQNAELSALRESLLQQLGGPEDGEFDPHLSLIYKKMPAEVREDLARRIELPFARVRFAELRAISTPVPVESAKEVQAWTTMWKRPLAQ